MVHAYWKPALRVLAVLAFAAALPAPRAMAAGGVGDLFITSDASNIVRAYNGATGAFIGNHSAAVLGSGQLAIHFSTTSDRVLVGSFGGGVDEYVASTGAYIKTYNPGPDWQWAGLYSPNGNVLIGNMTTNDVREYDSTTGAFISVLCPCPGPADMKIGPNGNLYICSYTNSLVREVNVLTGAPINQWSQTFGDRTNDIAFLPNGNILVTVMTSNVCYVYSPALVLLTSFAGTGWFRPHGIDISPSDGNIYIVDGVTTQVHVFDPVTFTELNPAFRSPDPEDKIVDLEFRPDFSDPTPVLETTTWGRVKSLFQ